MRIIAEVVEQHIAADSSSIVQSRSQVGFCSRGIERVLCDVNELLHGDMSARNK